MSDRSKYKLGEISKIIGGGTPSTTIEEYWNGDIPWLTPRDLTNYNLRYIERGERNITESGLKNSSARPLPKGTVLLTSRAPIGYLAIAANEICTNQGFKSFVVDEARVNNVFLYYLLLCNVEYLKSLGTGTTFSEVSGSALKDVEFTFPEIEEQEEIASILSSLDDKIELNLQMNQTLEAMSQAIFEEWFVNFNFPGFDGELVEGLPKKWTMRNLGDVCERITKGTTPTTLKKQFVENGINFIKVEAINDIGNFIPEKFAFIDEETNELLKRSIIQENDIVFTIAGTLGRVAKADKSILPANTNQAVAIIRIRDENMVNFIFHLLRSEKVKNNLTSKAVHAVQANISLGVLSSLEIILPNTEFIERLNLVLDPIQNKLLVNVYEIRTLTQIRDILLPKLMTGKIALNK